MCVREARAHQHASHLSTLTCWCMLGSCTDHPHTGRRQSTLAAVLLAFVVCTFAWQILSEVHDAEVDAPYVPLESAWSNSWPAHSLSAACGSGSAVPLLCTYAPGFLNNSSISSSRLSRSSSGSWTPLVVQKWQPAGASWLATGAAARFLRAVPSWHHQSKRVLQLEPPQSSTQGLTSSSSSSSISVSRRQLQTAGFLPLLGLALGLVSQVISPFAQICDDIQVPGARYACASSYAPTQPQVEPPISKPATNRSDLEPRPVALCAGQLGAPLTTGVIQAVKKAALQQLQQDLPEVYSKQDQYRVVNASSGIIHPAQMMGPAEVALMQYRVQQGLPPTMMAFNTLLNGSLASRKMYRNATGVWWPPTGTPLEWKPHALPELVVKYGGVTPAEVNATAPAHYTGPRTPGGPWQHILLVEMDGVQVYRQALAYLATGNEQYARNAIDIADAWATTNKVFGVVWENGPLEAGWFVASVVKGLELLKYTWPGYSTYKPDMEANFNSWVDKLVLPSWFRYLTYARKETNQFGNWHSTIAEGLMQLGLYRDNVTMVQEAVDLWTETHDNVLKWGSSNWTQIAQAKPDIDLLVKVYNEPQVAAAAKPGNASASSNSTSSSSGTSPATVAARLASNGTAVGNSSLPAGVANSTAGAGNTMAVNTTAASISGTAGTGAGGTQAAASVMAPPPPVLLTPQPPPPPPAAAAAGGGNSSSAGRVLLAEVARISAPAIIESGNSSSGGSRSLQFFLPGLDFSPMLRHYKITRPALEDQGWGFTTSAKEAPTTVISFGPFGIRFGPAGGGGGDQVPGDGSGDTITIRAEDYPNLPRSMVDLLNAPRAVVPRERGEGTETLRDLYHTQFGLGSLVQVAELAWQQNIDLYSRSNNLMKDSLELHAELILKFPAKLPPGWADVQKMVKPPPGPDGKPLVWKFDMATQTWYAQDVKGRKLIPLLDGVKYLVGVGFLPFGWEVAYNHYVGRRGLQMPWTQQLLERFWPEGYDFHWGAGTLTHADSARRLWTPGLGVHACKAGTKGKWWLHPLGKVFGSWLPGALGR